MTTELDRLVKQLEVAGMSLREQGVRPCGPDGIDAVLSDPPRTTAVRSLRDAPEMEAFRRELVDGLIRVDTANQLLRLVNDILLRVLQ